MKHIMSFRALPATQLTHPPALRAGRGAGGGEPSRILQCARVLCIALLTAQSAFAADDPPQAPANDATADITRQIDAIFAEAWRAQGVTPTERTGDAAFIRRVTLDLTGIIPEVGEVRAFLADERPDKRERLIDELLQRPRHSAHLAGLWREVLLPRTVEPSLAAGFENWLQDRFLTNQPYDELVREILLARGGFGQSPPVTYYAALNTSPSELAASTSRAFLGVQIRCAECHDHPFTDWKQADFWGLAAFFARTRGPGDMYGSAALDDGPSGEVQIPKTTQTVAPALLDGAQVELTAGEPRRSVLARWMTADENPYFAHAAVNRVWSILFGRGLVQPVDDFGAHNPATHEAVLDLLARDFIAHDYNLQRTFRIVAATDLYQLSSVPAAGDNSPLVTYTSMPVRSLSARQVYECLIQAAGRRDPADRAASNVYAERIAFVTEVEAPTRQATEFQGGIPQALTLLNGPLVTGLTDPQQSDRVAALVDNPFLSSEERIEVLFLATLSRPPEPGELQGTLEWLKRSNDQAQALSDTLWALLNSSEFILNH